MRGPKKTPTATLAARGSWRANTRPNEPMPEPVDSMAPPSTVKGRAAKIWKSLAPRLAQSGLLTTADVHSLERYCRLLAAWESAMKAVELDATRQNVLALSTLDKLVRQLERGFGLTPADRAGLAVEQPEPMDGKERFFRGAA